MTVRLHCQFLERKLACQDLVEDVPFNEAHENALEAVEETRRK